MKCIIIKKEASEFTTKDGTQLKGWNVTMLRENLTCPTYWIAQDKMATIGIIDKMFTNPFNGEKPIVVEVFFDEKMGFTDPVTKIKGASKIVPTSVKPI